MKVKEFIELREYMDETVRFEADLSEHSEIKAIKAEIKRVTAIQNDKIEAMKESFNNALELLESKINKK